MMITVLNNNGGGFAEKMNVRDGMTLEDLFASHSSLVGMVPSNFTIRVNKQPATAGQVLTEGSLVSITPLKVGAGR
jgi:sulfur carrier protein ThiS